jgi:hypothetical protein
MERWELMLIVPAKYIITFFAQQTAQISPSPAYIRSLNFNLQYARTNAQSRKLKGLPTNDEPSPEPSTWLAIHEFEEKVSEDVTKKIKGHISDLEMNIGAVNGEVFVWRLDKVHGEGKMFD